MLYIFKLYMGFKQFVLWRLMKMFYYINIHIAWIAHNKTRNVNLTKQQYIAYIKEIFDKIFKDYLQNKKLDTTLYADLYFDLNNINYLYKYTFNITRFVYIYLSKLYFKV